MSSQYILGHQVDKNSAVEILGYCFYIKNRKSNLGIRIEEDSDDNGAHIIQWSEPEKNLNKSSNMSPLFRLFPADGGSFYIVSVLTGKFMDVKDKSNKNDQNIVIWEREKKSQTQIFDFLPEDSESYFFNIKNRYSQKFLNIYHEGTSKGDKLVQYLAYTNDASKFQLSTKFGLQYNFRFYDSKSGDQSDGNITDNNIPVGEFEFSRPDFDEFVKVYIKSESQKSSSPDFDPVLVSRSLRPFYQVVDDYGMESGEENSNAWKVQNSPYYLIEKFEGYVNIDVYASEDSIDQNIIVNPIEQEKLEKTITIGFLQQEVDRFTSETKVTAGANTGGENPKASFQLEQTFTKEIENLRQKQEEKKETRTITHFFGVSTMTWQKYHLYKLKRIDGFLLDSWKVFESETRTAHYPAVRSQHQG